MPHRLDHFIGIGAVADQVATADHLVKLTAGPLQDRLERLQVGVDVSQDKKSQVNQWLGTGQLRRPALFGGNTDFAQGKFELLLGLEAGGYNPCLPGGLHVFPADRSGKEYFLGEDSRSIDGQPIDGGLRFQATQLIGQEAILDVAHQGIVFPDKLEMDFI